MAKQLTIKQISELSGVSSGTVDRILHNRGRVSAKAREQVEAVLAREGYKYNIHSSAVSLKKSYVIGVVCPMVISGGYWKQIRDGISQATEEYSDIDIRIVDFPYNQYDYVSCKEVYDAVKAQNLDAVVIGGTFEDLTRELCGGLDERNIPYVFVDAGFENCSPVGCFIPDQKVSGRIMARMADSMSAPGKKITVLRINRAGDVHSHNTDGRMAGVTEYFAGKNREVEQYYFTVGWKKELMEFAAKLSEKADVGALLVMNSWSHLVCDVLSGENIEGMIVCGFDATEDNLRCLKDSKISFLLDQHPQKQGFASLECLIKYLLYKTPQSAEDSGTIQVNILIKEML